VIIVIMGNGGLHFGSGLLHKDIILVERVFQVLLISRILNTLLTKLALSYAKVVGSR
jgi:hypothetical protein